MKTFFKIVILSSIVFITCIIGIRFVLASANDTYYTSYLRLLDEQAYGSTRAYATGLHRVGIGFTNENTSNSKFEMTYQVKNTKNQYDNIETITITAVNNGVTTYVWNKGNTLSAGYYRYYFSRKINGITYQPTYANLFYMWPKA